MIDDHYKYYCHECKHHTYNVMGEGFCACPDVLEKRSAYCIACEYLELRRE